MHRHIADGLKTNFKTFSKIKTYLVISIAKLDDK